MLETCIAMNSLLKHRNLRDAFIAQSENIQFIFQTMGQRERSTVFRFVHCDFQLVIGFNYILKTIHSLQDKT